MTKKSELEGLKKQATVCHLCELYKRGTQTVFGDGNPSAKVFLVGEQPGDQEDLQGKPFVGPAGKLLWSILHEAGFEAKDVYVTNAVKHFNWRASGKKRIHEKPKASHINACHVWLEAEVALVKPFIIVCLGVTAGRAVFGRPVTIRADGDKIVSTPLCEKTILTIHPSAILRMQDKEDRDQAREDMLTFFKRVKKLCSS